MSDKYSDAVLDLKFQAMQEQNDARFDQLLQQGARIENQTTKTNGHVAVAFKDIEELKQSRTGLTYAFALFVLVVLPILGVTLLRVWDTKQVTQVQVQQAVQTGVDNALLNYEKTNP